MKVLFVCSGNFNGKFENAQVFVYEQIQELKQLGVTCDLFLLKGNGIKGYMANVIKLRNFLTQNKYDIVHAIYGLSGFVASFQFKAKLITTFIGSDINSNNKLLAQFVVIRSNHSIFVSNALSKKIVLKRSFSIQPFGVDTEIFYPQTKKEAREQIGIRQDERVILFSSYMSNPVKNYRLASKAIELLPFPVRIIELGKSFSRIELNPLFNSSDLLLMTSFNEGSPQVIKEAMACNLPIVSTNVGDVEEITGKTDGTYICTYEPKDVAEKIIRAFKFTEMNGKTKSRNRIVELGLDNRMVATKIHARYQNILKRNEQ